ncbi:MAG TPA: hypothetical protein VHU88_21045, partial [Sporichthyaceae bacterium]|nr:hypothetical protein [Sporichthyaceae bacterium]
MCAVEESTDGAGEWQRSPRRPGSSLRAVLRPGRAADGREIRVSPRSRRAGAPPCATSPASAGIQISVAGPGEKLLVSRNAHKSVIAGVIISGIWPVWVHPKFDAALHLAHPPEPQDVRAGLAAH